MKFFLDTNFLLLPFQFRVDVKRELGRLADEHGESVELFTVQACIDELQALGAKKDKDARHARSALASLAKLGVRVLQNEPGAAADTALVEEAKKMGGVACSGDYELRRRARQAGVQTVALRSKNHLAFA